MNRSPCVIIVGAGFGGLWAVRTLRSARAETVLVDRNNYHTFLPLLYQVSTAELEPESIAYPVRSILRGIPNASFVLADVRNIDLKNQTIATGGAEIGYDYLVLALGSATNYFDVPGAARHAFVLKNLNQGIALRNHILKNFERASLERDPAVRQKLLTFVVVGGGPTGIEFAGALAELIHGPLVKDFPSLDFGKIRILILEAADGLLPGMPRKIREYAFKRLNAKGVAVLKNALVGEVTADSVRLGEGSEISTATVLWTAGVRGAPLAQLWGLPLDNSGRIPVLDTLQVPGFPNVYAVGDLAAVEVEGRALPMIAPVAVQEGAWAAKNIMRQIGGKSPEPFHYRDRGMMITIGRNAAVAHLKGFTATGFPAWLLWLGVHLYNLIGFRNRLLTLINWSWDYFFYERVVRLILP